MTGPEGGTSSLHVMLLGLHLSLVGFAWRAEQYFVAGTATEQPMIVVVFGFLVSVVGFVLRLARR